MTIINAAFILLPGLVTELKTFISLRVALTVSSLNPLQTFLLWKQPTHCHSMQPLYPHHMHLSSLFSNFSLIPLLCSSSLNLLFFLCHLPQWGEQHTRTHIKTFTCDLSHSHAYTHKPPPQTDAHTHKGLQERLWKKLWNEENKENVQLDGRQFWFWITYEKCGKWVTAHSNLHTHPGQRPQMAYFCTSKPPFTLFIVQVFNT